MSKWYLAGPMSGIKSFNIPAFEEAATWLRTRALEDTTIVSPAEMDREHSPEGYQLALASPDGDASALKSTLGTWGDVLARDVKRVADEVDGIIFLDDWEQSRGARLEAFVGLLTGKKFGRLVYAYSHVDDGYGYETKARGPLIDVEQVDAAYVREMLRNHMPGAGA